MTHAWLLTGPPGSGRSVAARAFAAALECPQHGCGECRECRTAVDGTHADVDVIATEGLSIKVEQARELVQLSALRPSVGPWRVIIIEDADRLTERAADALLKAIEEPVARTVWILCAPSLEDVVITIRSRSRHVRLRTPPAEAVAELLHRRDGVEMPMAMYAARAAQSHVGLARRLARDEGARIRRRDVIGLAGKIHGVGDAIGAAADLASIADEESTAGGRRARRRGAAAAHGGARGRPVGPHPAAAHPQPALRPREGAEGPGHPPLPRRARPVARRPAVGLPRRAGPAQRRGPRAGQPGQPAASSRARPVDERRAAAPGDGRHRHGPRADRPQRRPLLALEAMAISLRVPR